MSNPGIGHNGAATDADRRKLRGIHTTNQPSED